MKKMLSVFLAALLVLCCLPFTAFAANEVVFSTNAEFTESHQLASGTEYIIPEGVTMTVPASLTLLIPRTAKLTVAKGGKLVIYGDIMIADTGELWASGEIINGTRIKKEVGAENAVAMAQFRFPDLNDPSVKLADRVSVSFHYDGVDGREGADPKVVPVGGGEYFMPIGQEIQINAHILEDSEKDPSKPRMIRSLWGRGYRYCTDGE